LPEAASGMLEPRHCVVPLRMMCPHAELLLGRAVGLDETARTVEVRTDAGPMRIAYGQLVVAFGSVSRTLPIPGLAEHGLHLRDALRYYPILRDVPQHWALVDAAPKILPEIPTGLGEYAADLLAKRGVDIRVSTTLEAAEDDSVRLSDGSTIETRTLVWTAGV